MEKGSCRLYPVPSLTQRQNSAPHIPEVEGWGCRDPPGNPQVHSSLRLPHGGAHGLVLVSEDKNEGVGPRSPCLAAGSLRPHLMLAAWHASSYRKAIRKGRHGGVSSLSLTPWADLAT